MMHEMNRSNGVFASPFPSSGLVPRTVRLVDVSDLGHERVVGVGVGEHGANGEQHYEGQSYFWSATTGPLTFGDRQSRTPLVPQDIQTDAAVRVDVGVVDASSEVDLWRLEWVVGREVDR
jgi:hypothetical protein